MSHGVRIAERCRRLGDGRDAVNFGTTIIAQIVHNIGREELSQPLELTLIHEVTVKAHQLVDRQTIAQRERRDHVPCHIEYVARWRPRRPRWALPTP